MKPKEQLLFLEQIAKVLAAQFGSLCEVAVHDLTAGQEGVIAAIENGHVTGRGIGDSGVGPGQQPGDVGDLENTLCKLTRTSDGRLLKTSTVYLQGEGGPAQVALSIHYDVTALSHANMILSRFLSNAPAGEAPQGKPAFANVNDVLEQLIEESVAHVGKPVALMSKEDKIKAIHFLDKKGAFLIKKSGDKISRFYDISKYTLYNYMDSDLAP